MQAALGAAPHLLILNEDLVPERPRVFPPLFEHRLHAETLRELGPDPTVGLSVAWGVDHPIDPHHPPVLTRTPHLALLDAGCRGQHIVRVSAGLVSKQVDVHQQVEGGQPLPSGGLIRPQ